MSNRPETTEAFFTPPGVLDDLISTGILNGVTSILEPSAGCGNIIKRLREIGFDHHITAIEPESEYLDDLMLGKPTKLHHGSFFDTVINNQTIGTFDLAIVNPPYSLIEPFLVRAYDFVNDGGRMAALLRLGHLVGVKRYEFFSRYRPSDVYLLTRRPQFSNGPGDIGGHAWVVWDKPMSHEILETRLHWISTETAYARGTDRRVDNGYKRFPKDRGHPTTQKKNNRKTRETI